MARTAIQLREFFQRERLDETRLPVFALVDGNLREITSTTISEYGYPIIEIDMHSPVVSLKDAADRSQKAKKAPKKK